jgi:hypothetical protein
MKTSKFFLSAIFLSIIFLVSCSEKNETETKIITFEDVTLSESGYWNGSDLSGEPKKEDPYEMGIEVTNYYGSFASGIANFENVYTAEWGSWMGFACSNQTDTETAGWINQYSVIVGKGAENSEKFAVAYDNATIKFSNTNSSYSVKNAMITNSTYAYLYMKNGDTPYTANDWLKVSFKGFLGNVETGSVDYYLADFRNGKSFISNTWEKVDLSTLGEVDAIKVSFAASDIMAPTYCCIDNLTVEVTE